MASPTGRLVRSLTVCAVQEVGVVMVPDASEFGIPQRLPGAVLTEISVATIMLATQRVDQADVSACPCCFIAGPL